MNLKSPLEDEMGFGQSPALGETWPGWEWGSEPGESTDAHAGTKMGQAMDARWEPRRRQIRS